MHELQEHAGLLNPGVHNIPHQLLMLCKAAEPCAWLRLLDALRLHSQARFPQGFSQAGALGAARGQLRHGADYLMAAHTELGRFVVQVRRLLPQQRVPTLTLRLRFT